MTKNTRTLRKLKRLYDNYAMSHGPWDPITKGYRYDIFKFINYDTDKYRLSKLRNHIPPTSKPNQYKLRPANSYQQGDLSIRQRKKLARFKQARVCETSRGLVVVLDSNAIFQ